MEGRKAVPKQRDLTLLPGGGKLGVFWTNCKAKRKCRRQPYDRLLTNPVLRADYRTLNGTIMVTVMRRRMWIIYGLSCPP